MKQSIIRQILSLGLILFSASAFSQCEILSRVYPDGTMVRYIEPVNFYWTQSKSLKGGIQTDNESFYLGLQPIPFPDKPVGRKLKDDLEVKLANDSIYLLKHFDTRYMDHDTVMQLLYLIDKTDVDVFLQYEVISVNINMQGTEGMRTYVFKLHKNAIREQLDCFLKEKEEKKKK